MVPGGALAILPNTADRVRRPPQWPLPYTTPWHLKV